MRKTILAVFAFFIYCAGYAQLHKTALPPNFSDSLEKIALDFRLDYHSIQNNSSISQQDDYEMYAPYITLPGSTDCAILRFHSVEDSTAAYQASFYSGDDYNEASKAYKKCVRLIKSAKMKWIDRTPMSFSGKEEEPSQSMPFTTTILRLNLDDKRYKDFCAEIDLKGDVTGWQVQVSFHNKRSDTEGPTE
jgi:hypothetical protein